MFMVLKVLLGGIEFMGSIGLMERLGFKVVSL